MTVKKVIIIALCVLGVAGVAAGISIPLAINGAQESESRRSEEEKNRLNAALNLAYDSFVSDAQDGVIDPTAYQHLEGKFDTEQGVQLLRTPAKEDMIARLNTDSESESLYVYRSGGWTAASKGSLLCDESSALVQYKDITGSYIGDIFIVSSKDQIGYSYLVYNGYQLCGS